MESDHGAVGVNVECMEDKDKRKKQTKEESYAKKDADSEYMGGLWETNGR